MANGLQNMTPERRILLATVLCVTVSVVFTLFIAPPPKPRDQNMPQIPEVIGGEEGGLKPRAEDSAGAPPPAPERAASATSGAEVSSTSSLTSSSAPLAQVVPLPATREFTIDTPRARYVFSTQGASLRSCRLKDYPENDPPLELLESERNNAKPPEEIAFWQARVEELRARLEDRGDYRYKKGEPVPETAWVELVPRYADTAEFPLSLHFKPGLNDQALRYEIAGEDLTLAAGQTASVTFTAETASGLVFIKAFTFSGDKPEFEVSVQTRISGGAQALAESLGRHWVIEWPDGLAHLPFHYPGSQEENQLRILLNDSMQSPTTREWLRKQAVGAGEVREYRHLLEGRVGWIGIETRYFLATLIPQSPTVQGVFMTSGLLQRPAAVETRMGVGLIAPFSDLPQRFQVYVGPKVSHTLAKLGGGLDRLVYDSWFGSICLLVEWLLGIFYALIPSYGIAIVLLCVFSKIVLYPLTYKQAQTQMRMAELQPKIAELKEKYKDDTQKFSQEQMKLWKKHGVNPASGCLPMLAQLPIFIALYRTIQSSIDLRGAPFLWISDLSLPDMTLFLPVNVPFLGSVLNVLPIVMTAVSLWQMHEQKKMMPDPSQGQMMMFMTLFFFVILYHFSAGLVLYWLTNSVTQIIQQKIMEHLGHAATPAARLAALPGQSAVLTPSQDGDEPDIERPAAARPALQRARPGKRKTGKS
jgi:YidC/Oxa1 family membrane protein insertase